MNLEDSPSYNAFRSAPYKSTKRSSYFWVYDLLLEKYVGKPVTVVEVGVLNGGGLFMLRQLLGESARIIGVDLNPECKYFEKYGFEIYTLNQSNPVEWKAFFEKIGPIDVLIEDGGHTNKQQINTAIHSIEYIIDGGIYVSEDTHTSYWREFGNPSKWSFVEFAKSIVESINGRGPNVNTRIRHFAERISSVQFFESMVCLHVDSQRTHPSERTVNSGTSLKHIDYRNLDKTFRNVLATYLSEKSERTANPKALSLRLSFRIINLILGIIYRVENFSLRKYF